MARHYPTRIPQRSGPPRRRTYDNGAGTAAAVGTILSIGAAILGGRSGGGGWRRNPCVNGTNLDGLTPDATAIAGSVSGRVIEIEFPDRTPH